MPSTPPPPGAATSYSESAEERRTRAKETAEKLVAEATSLDDTAIPQAQNEAITIPVKDDGGDADEPEFVPAKKRKVDLSGTPTCSLVGKKWSITHQNGALDDDAITIDGNTKHTVHVYKWYNSLIRVYGKVNAVFLDSCSALSCVFEELSVGAEIVNCKDLEVQCLRGVPSVSIDGCSALTYYMSPTYADSQIITTKSTDVSLVRPVSEEGTLIVLLWSLVSFRVLPRLLPFRVSDSLWDCRGEFPLLIVFWQTMRADFVETPVPELFV